MLQPGLNLNFFEPVATLLGAEAEAEGDNCRYQAITLIIRGRHLTGYLFFSILLG